MTPGSGDQNRYTPPGAGTPPEVLGSLIGPSVIATPARANSPRYIFAFAAPSGCAASGLISYRCRRVRLTMSGTRARSPSFRAVELAERPKAARLRKILA